MLVVASHPLRKPIVDVRANLSRTYPSSVGGSSIRSMTRDVARARFFAVAPRCVDESATHECHIRRQDDSRGAAGAADDDDGDDVVRKKGTRSERKKKGGIKMETGDKTRRAVRTAR